LGIELARATPVSFKYAYLPAAIAIAYATWSWKRAHQQESLRLSISMTLIVGVQTFIFHQFEFPVSQYEWGALQWHAAAWLVMAAFSLILFLVRFRKMSIIENPIEYFLIFGAILLFFMPVGLKGDFSTDLMAIELLCFFVVYRMGTVSLELDEEWLPSLGAFALVTLLIYGTVQ
jgi:hypothetical protein